MNISKFLQSLIGLTKEQAKQACLTCNYSLRTTMEDGVGKICTMDFRLDRINVHIEKGIITKATVG